jgi:hypothetical protein
VHGSCRPAGTCVHMMATGGRATAMGLRCGVQWLQPDLVRRVAHDGDGHVRRGAGPLRQQDAREHLLVGRFGRSVDLVGRSIGWFGRLVVGWYVGWLVAWWVGWSLILMYIPDPSWPLVHGGLYVRWGLYAPTSGGRTPDSQVSSSIVNS